MHTSARSVPWSGGPGTTGSVSHHRMLFRSRDKGRRVYPRPEARKAAPAPPGLASAKVFSLPCLPEMASRKEEKERLRKQRLAAERRAASSGQRRLMLGYVVAGVLAAAVVVGIVVVIASGSGGGGGGEDGDIPEEAHVDTQGGFAPTFGVAPDGREGTPPPAVEQARLGAAAKEAGCGLQLNLPDEGNNHLSANEDTPKYDTNPPTSGDHDPQPQADGAFAEEPEPRHFVHSLEHGRIEIQYSPDLPEKDQLALKGVFDEDPNGMLMFPNPDMPYEVAATAWTNLLGCKKYDGPATLDAIRAFRDTLRGQGPEPIPL